MPNVSAKVLIQMGGMKVPWEKKTIGGKENTEILLHPSELKDVQTAAHATFSSLVMQIKRQTFKRDNPLLAKVRFPFLSFISCSYPQRQCITS